MAFCHWLTDALRCEIRLPTEPEWERAARYAPQARDYIAKEPGPNYPWGDQFGVNLCNMNKTGIGSTSAVGLFPNGNALCRAADLSGNVWEWCSTQWLGNYETYAEKVSDELDGDNRRLLRGGSFDVYDNGVRCASRDLSCYPDRLNLIGFRVVLPGSEALISVNSDL